MIDGSQADNVEVGGTIILTCSYKMAGLFQLEWTDPISVINDVIDFSLLFPFIPNR